MGFKKYDILSRVLEYSIQKNCPDADLEMLRIPPPKGYPSKRCFAANTLKIQKWVDIMNITNDNIVFLDCDMLVLRDISDIFEDDFDIGLTIRGTGSIPYNGGAVFVRNSQKAKDYMELWNEVNIHLYNNPKEHNYWRNKKGYAGMNQAALGCLMETKKYQANVKKYPCAIWNLCRNHWNKITDESRILHIKSGLRKAVFARASSIIVAKYQKAISIWLQYAKEAGIHTNMEVKKFLDTQEKIKEKAKSKLKRRRTWFEKALGRKYSDIAKISRKRRR